MTDILREEVLKDTGTSKLKQKVLDLISKLRVEAKVINASKEAMKNMMIKKKKDQSDSEPESSESEKVVAEVKIKKQKSEQT